MPHSVKVGKKNRSRSWTALARLAGTVCGAFVLSLISVAGATIRLSAAHGQTVAQPASGQLEQGIAALRSGDAEKALAQFQEANRLQPGSAQPLVWIGIAENQLGRFEDAAAALRSALRLDPASQAAHYNLALSLIRLGDDAAAIRELEAAVEVDPGLADAQFNLAVLLRRHGRDKEAIPHLIEAARARPNDAEISLGLIAAYVKTDQHPRALKLAMEMQNQPISADTASELGSVLIEGGEFQAAVTVLKKALSQAPLSVPLTITLAQAYAGQDNFQDAIRLLSPLRETDPSGHAAYTLGVVYLSENRVQDAEASFAEAVRLDPQNAAAHFQLGLALLKLGPPPGSAEGAKELAAAIELAPHEGQYYAALGTWLLEMNRSADALNLLQHAIQNATPDAELYLLLGISQASVSGVKAAQPSIEKSIELDPRIALAYNILGYCYFISGDTVHALDAYKKAVDLGPHTARFDYDVALLLEKTQQPSAGLPYAQQAATLQPGNGLYHYLIGKFYVDLNENEEAVKELEASVQIDPNLDASHYLLARAYKQLGNTAKAQAEFKRVEELKQAADRTAGASALPQDSSDVPSPSLELATPGSGLEQSRPHEP